MTYLLIDNFSEEGLLGRLFTGALRPMMKVLQGSFSEESQGTHFWNRTKIEDLQQSHLLQELSVIVEADLEAGPMYRFGLPIFHIPVLGGWKNYAVVGPTSETGTWFLGWYTEGAFGISRIPVQGPVRALRGNHETRFFGVNRDLKQIFVSKIGSGTIGQGGPFCQLPLL